MSSLSRREEATAQLVGGCLGLGLKVVIRLTITILVIAALLRYLEWI
jgi:hypothetical protein